MRPLPPASDATPQQLSDAHVQFSCRQQKNVHELLAPKVNGATLHPALGDSHSNRGRAIASHDRDHLRHVAASVGRSSAVHRKHLENVFSCAGSHASPAIPASAGAVHDLSDLEQLTSASHTPEPTTDAFDLLQDFALPSANCSPEPASAQVRRAPASWHRKPSRSAACSPPLLTHRCLRVNAPM